MKRFITTLVLALLFHSATACDLCGGGANNQNPYLFPQYSRSFVGLSYQHTRYTLNSDGKEETQYNHAIVFTTQYAVDRRLQLTALVPYQLNRLTSAYNPINNQGVGDITLLANYNVARKLAGTTEHALNVGGGLKLPSGKYNVSKTGEVTDQNFQLGTGSVDYSANLSYRFSVSNFSLNVVGAYKYTTANKEGYRYGDQLTTAATAIYSFDKRDLKLSPYLQVMNEIHYRDANKHILQDHSGGNVLYTGAGADVSTQKITLGLNYQFAVEQNLVNGELQAKPRFSARIAFPL